MPASIGGRGGQFGVTLRPCLSTATSGAPENTRHRGGELGTGGFGWQWKGWVGWSGGEESTKTQIKNREIMRFFFMFFFWYYSHTDASCGMRASTVQHLSDKILMERLHNSPCDTTAISNPGKKSYCCSGICNYQLTFQTLFQHTELEHTPKSLNHQFMRGLLYHLEIWGMPIRCQETSRLTMSHVCIFISSMMLNKKHFTSTKNDCRKNPLSTNILSQALQRLVAHPPGADLGCSGFSHFNRPVEMSGK